MLGYLFKAVAAVVTVPVAVVADVVTLGGLANGQPVPYTLDAVHKVAQAIIPPK